MKPQKEIKIKPNTRLGGRDIFWLSWCLVNFLACGIILVLMLVGVFNDLELSLIQLLGGHPFYMSAQEAQVTLMGPVGTLGLCVGLSLYLSFVLLREPRWYARAQMCLLSFLAVSLPCFLGLLAGGVLNMAAPMLLVLILWGLTTLYPLFRYHVKARFS